MKRNQQGQFEPTNKPIATLTQTGDSQHYVLSMGGREIGGGKSALIRYARNNGYLVKGA